MGLTGSLIFFSQHERDDPLGDGGVSRIWRVEAQGLVVVVDLEHDRSAIEIKFAKVMLAVRIVSRTKITKGGMV